MVCTGYSCTMSLKVVILSPPRFTCPVPPRFPLGIGPKGVPPVPKAGKGPWACHHALGPRPYLWDTEGNKEAGRLATPSKVPCNYSVVGSQKAT